MARPCSTKPEKATDNIPWMLYKDGIRELRLLKDFEREELDPLLDILQRVRKVSPDEDDLLTLLWEQEFRLSATATSIVSTDQAAPIDKAGYRGGEAGAQALQESAPPIDSTVAAVVNLDDFDSTLYFLDESEIEYLREEVRRSTRSTCGGTSSRCCSTSSSSRAIPACARRSPRCSTR